MSNIIPFNYFGGKFNHVDWILYQLPETKSFVDVFGGSGIVIFNKKPSKIETYNDINGKMVNFFEQLRKHGSKLLEQIYLTPYSREEYHNCYKSLNKGSKLEQARKLFVVLNQSFNGISSRQTGWKMSTKETRANISEAVSRWNSKIPNLISTIDRLKNIQISNFDFRLLFQKFNAKDVLLYCDPPYMFSTRCNNNEFEFEMSDKDHIELLELCLETKAYVAISGYDNDLYNNMLDSWYKSVGKVKRTTIQHSKRQEILWMNYNPEHIQENLFTSNHIKEETV